MFGLFKNKNTALVEACENLNLKKVERLLKKGADPDTLNSEDDVILTWACTNNHIELVKLLLSAGADVNLKGKAGDGIYLYNDSTTLYFNMPIKAGLLY